MYDNFYRNSITQDNLDAFVTEIGAYIPSQVDIRNYFLCYF